VKKIIEEHQGTITIENIKTLSSNETGAVVLVSLPILNSESKKRSVKAKKVDAA
jgi:nitrogen fixation/metabolism regulation signal transduction histidine kinase